MFFLPCDHGLIFFTTTYICENSSEQTIFTQVLLPLLTKATICVGADVVNSCSACCCCSLFISHYLIRYESSRGHKDGRDQTKSNREHVRRKNTAKADNEGTDKKVASNGKRRGRREGTQKRDAKIK